MLSTSLCTREAKRKAPLCKGSCQNLVLTEGLRIGSEEMPGLQIRCKRIALFSHIVYNAAENIGIGAADRVEKNDRAVVGG